MVAHDVTDQLPDPASRGTKRSADKMSTPTRKYTELSLLGRQKPDLAGLPSPMRSFTETGHRRLERKTGNAGDIRPPSLGPGLDGYSYPPFEAQSPIVQLGHRLPNTYPDSSFTPHDEAPNYGPKAAVRPESNASFLKKSQWAYSSAHIIATDSGERHGVVPPAIGVNTAIRDEVRNGMVPIIGDIYDLHGISSPQQPADRPFKGHKYPPTFDRNHDLKRHKRIHVTIKPFICTFCDGKFSREDALKRHMKICGESCGYPSGSLGDGAKTWFYDEVLDASYHVPAERPYPEETHVPLTPIQERQQRVEAYQDQQLQIDQLQLDAAIDAHSRMLQGIPAPLPRPQQRYIKRPPQEMTEAQRQQKVDAARHALLRATALKQKQNKRSQRQAMANVRMNERHTDSSKLVCFQTLAEDRSVNEKQILLCAIASKEVFGRHKAPSLALLHHKEQPTHRGPGQREQQVSTIKAAGKAGLVGSNGNDVIFGDLPFVDSMEKLRDYGSEITVGFAERQTTPLPQPVSPITYLSGVEFGTLENADVFEKIGFDWS